MEWFSQDFYSVFSLFIFSINSKVALLESLTLEISWYVDFSDPRFSIFFYIFLIIALHVVTWIDLPLLPK